MRIEVMAVPITITEHLWVVADYNDQRDGEILRARDLILYFSWPNEATSAGVALQLKRRGNTRVHPLKGGLARWMALSFPVADLRSREPTAPPPRLIRRDQAERC